MRAPSLLALLLVITLVPLAYAHNSTEQIALDSQLDDIEANISSLNGTQIGFINFNSTLYDELLAGNATAAKNPLAFLVLFNALGISVNAFDIGAAKTDIVTISSNVTDNTNEIATHEDAIRVVELDIVDVKVDVNSVNATATVENPKKISNNRLINLYTEGLISGLSNEDIVELTNDNSTRGEEIANAKWLYVNNTEIPLYYGLNQTNPIYEPYLLQAYTLLDALQKILDNYSLS